VGVEREGAGALPGCEVLDLGVVTAGDDAAPEAGAGREAVDPRHRVPVGGVAGLEVGHAGVEVGRPPAVDHHARRRDRPHPQRRLDDDACEAEPAGGGPERVVVRRELEPAPVGQVEHHRLDVVAEAAVVVVVLAVDVAGDGAAHGDVARARGDRHEEAERHEGPHQRVEADPGGDGDLGAGHVDQPDGVEPRAVDDGAARRLGGVPVAAAEAAGDDVALAVQQGLAHVVARLGSEVLGGGGRGATPTRDQPHLLRLERAGHAV
jgi:hypothetical protein